MTKLNSNGGDDKVDELLKEDGNIFCCQAREFTVNWNA